MHGTLTSAGMARITVDKTQLAGLATFVRGVVRFLRRTAAVGVLGVVAIAALLARGGFSAFEAIVTILLLAPPAILLLFAQGVRELLSLPERLRRIPSEGQERVAELTRLAGQARTTGIRGMPILLWRLRGTVGSLRDIAGLAVQLRALTPGFFGLALLSMLACAVLAGVGLIALLVLAAG
jgi:hypothetical protein